MRTCVSVLKVQVLERRGAFIVKPTRDGEIKINVAAVIQGKTVSMGSGVYRVKYLRTQPPTLLTLMPEEYHVLHKMRH